MLQTKSTQCMCIPVYASRAQLVVYSDFYWFCDAITWSKIENRGMPRRGAHEIGADTRNIYYIYSIYSYNNAFQSGSSKSVYYMLIYFFVFQHMIITRAGIFYLKKNAWVIKMIKCEPQVWCIVMVRACLVTLP